MITKKSKAKQHAIDELWRVIMRYSTKATLSDAVGLLECVKYALLKLGNEIHDQKRKKK